MSVEVMPSMHSEVRRMVRVAETVRAKWMVHGEVRWTECVAETAQVCSSHEAK